MRSEQMEHLFERNGYCKVPSNLSEFMFYYREEGQRAIVLHIVDYRKQLELSEEQYAALKAKVIEFMRAKGKQKVDLLSIVLSNDTGNGKKLCAYDRFCWMIDMDNNRLIIYEDQTADFYGWRGILEEFLLAEDMRGNDQNGNDAAYGGLSGRGDWKWRKDLPWVTICLVAVNIIIFLICTITGDLLYNVGMLYFPQIVEDQAYYEIITSMFLHVDARHLFNNMIVLFFLGKIVEQKLGHVPYTVLYFLSGIAGDLLSIGCAMIIEREHVSLGASGAVFGVEGAFLVLASLGRCGTKSTQVILAILFSLYCGFTSVGVDNAAHVGGTLMGFALAAVFCMLYPDKTSNTNSNV